MGCVNAKALDDKKVYKASALPNDLSDNYFRYGNNFINLSIQNKEEMYLYDIPFKGNDSIM